MEQNQCQSEIHCAIDDLLAEYQSNPSVLKCLHHHIVHVLPSILTAANEREIRKQTLTSESETFVNEFLAQFRVFHCAYSESFFLYDDVHFSPIREDEVQYNILSSITNQSPLRPWKHRTKITTISAIKRRSPLSVIPESDTIQYVLDMLHPNVFRSRNQTKYFLTVIGDYLRDSPPERIYLASPCLKDLVRRLGDHMSELFGVHGALQSIKYKYYDHDYTNIRLLFIDESRCRIKAPPALNKHVVDVLCVAAHYSKRYDGADGFLMQCSDNALVDHARYLTNHTIEHIVGEFVANAIKPCKTAGILSKHMLFLWKKHLEEMNVPNIVFHEPLLVLLKEHLAYECATDTFTGITSPLLPTVATFLEFWGAHMVEDDECELEVGEVVLLLKRASKRVHLEESFMIELIGHFFPNTVIEDGKYLVGVKCSLWDKRQEVSDHIEVYRAVAKPGASLYDAYEHYSNSKRQKLSVSKRYYEKVAHDCLGENMNDFGLFTESWYINI